MGIIILRVCKTGRTCVLCASFSFIHHLATSQLCQHFRYAFYKKSEPLDFEGISLPRAIGFSRQRASDFHTALWLLKFREKVLMMKSVLNFYLNMHRTSPKRLLYPVFKWMEWRMAGISLIIHCPLQKRSGIVSPLEHLFAFFQGNNNPRLWSFHPVIFHNDSSFSKFKRHSQEPLKLIFFYEKKCAGAGFKLRAFLWLSHNHVTCPRTGNGGIGDRGNHRLWGPRRRRVNKRTRGE